MQHTTPNHTTHLHTHQKEQAVIGVESRTEEVAWVKGEDRDKVRLGKVGKGNVRSGMVLQNRRTVYPHCWIGHFYPPLRRFHHKRGAEEGVGGVKEGEGKGEKKEKMKEEEECRGQFREYVRPR